MFQKNRSMLVCFMSIFLCLMGTAMEEEDKNTTIRVNVGLIVDLDTRIGRMGWSCIEMAISDFYASHSHYKTRLVLHTRNSNNDVLGAAAAALDLIKNIQVQAIIGPQSSMQASFLINLGEKAHVPIVSFSATNPILTSLQSSYFFRATQNDSSQVEAISKIVQAFWWREVVPIYVDDEFGEGIIPYLVYALEKAGAHISPHRIVISPLASDDQLREKLYELKTIPTKIFIVHLYPDLAAKLFMNAQEVGLMGEGYAWIVTDAVAEFFGSFNESILDAMQGVLGVKTYVPKTEAINKLAIRWNTCNIEKPHQLNIFGLWAYDAAWALATAVENAGTTNLTYRKVNASSSTNLTEIETFGVNENGERLRDSLLNASFKGISGEFALLNGQLESSNFQIFNVIGSGTKSIGFWTPEGGLVNVLKTTNTSTKSTSRAVLAPVIWPGDTFEVPRGRHIPTDGKILRIGVPVNTEYKELVSIEHDNKTNRTMVSGYCIDVFREVVKTLPYALNYDFIPFATRNGEMYGSYNDLVYQVSTGTYDAAVGDITITANRSLYVDFTLPYTEPYLSMVVPKKARGISKNKAWVFLKPLTWDLWLTSGCFFVFIGLVVWFLEHRVNDDFRRGPHLHQLATSQWFSFSTMVFGQRELLASNLARSVVVVWCFVVFILTQSYTASLTSLLTVEQLQPIVSDWHQLLRNNDRVGYQKGSSVYWLLRSLGFDDSKLVSYASREEMDQLFRNGSSNGVLSAALDETPYIKLFIFKHSCSEYVIQKPFTLRSNGFGFAFPIGSPLVSEFSRGILAVTGGEKIDRIDGKWFGPNFSNCSISTTDTEQSTSLGLDSFLGLFLIAGVTAVLAVILFVVIFAHKEHDNLKRDVLSKNQIMQKMGALLELYDKRDTKFHIVPQSSEPKDGKNDTSNGPDHLSGIRVVAPVMDSPRSNGKPSSSNISTEIIDAYNSGHSTLQAPMAGSCGCCRAVSLNPETALARNN